MNTGIQDAFNLAWKLAYVIQGKLPASALDTYDEERHPVAVELLRSTDRMFQVLAHGSAGARLFLRYGVPLVFNSVARLAVVQRLAMRFVTQLRIHYPKPSLHASVGQGRRSSARLAPGRRLPDSPMQAVDSGDPVRLHQAIAREDYSLLLVCLSYAPQSLLPAAEAWREKLEKATGSSLKIRFVIGRGAHGVDGEGCLIDVGREFARLCALKTPALVLVRPDGYVGWSTALD